MAVKVYFFLALLLTVAISDVCNDCRECDQSDPDFDPVTRVCCDCGPDDDTTTTATPTTATPSESPEVGVTNSPSPAPTTGAPTSSTTTPQTTEPYSCAHWTSDRQIFGVAGGYPLNVCYAKWGGSQQSSESFMYKCSDDHSTVEWWKWSTTTECDDNIATAVKLPFAFDATLDDYNCAGDPCDYYIIEDGTAHPDQRCPYDVGTEYNTGENDYATWEHKLVLQGCQTFNGLTSTYAKCNEDDGISIYKYADPYCRGTAVATTFLDGTLQCNYGTGTSVYCFDDDMNTTAPTSSTTMDPSNTATTDDESTTTEQDPQHCSWGNCGSSGEIYKPSQLVGFCVIFMTMTMVWFKL